MRTWPSFLGEIVHARSWFPGSVSLLSQKLWIFSFWGACKSQTTSAHYQINLERRSEISGVNEDFQYLQRRPKKQQKVHACVALTILDFYFVQRGSEGAQSHLNLKPLWLIRIGCLKLARWELPCKPRRPLACRYIGLQLVQWGKHHTKRRRLSLQSVLAKTQWRCVFLWCVILFWSCWAFGEFQKLPKYNTDSRWHILGPSGFTK